jgi:hypothetical protein
MKKSDTPNGLSLSPEFEEAVKRIQNKEPELDAVIDKDNASQHTHAQLHPYRRRIQ